MGKIKSCKCKYPYLLNEYPKNLCHLCGNFLPENKLKSWTELGKEGQARIKRNALKVIKAEIKRKAVKDERD